MYQVDMRLVRGTGAAVDVELGYIPDMVLIYNHTDGTPFRVAFPKLRVMPFTSGSLALVNGDRIKGATSGATATVVEQIIDSGTIAAGDAAGWIIIDPTTKVGTFQTEAVYNDSDSTSGADDASVTVDVPPNFDSDTEVAAATGNAAVTALLGSSTVKQGVTLGSTISTDAKLLICTFWRRGAQTGPKLCANSL